MRTPLSSIFLLTTALLSGSALHAQSGPKIQHVLVISIDGMHSNDLSLWIQNNPNSTLASLAANSVNCPNAFTTQPSDSIPSTVGIFSGASPSLGGMYYDYAWHRPWSPKGSKCSTTGTAIDLKDTIDVTPIPAPPASASLDPNKLPLDPDSGCSQVFLHNPEMD